jgi:hypothetical protein
MSTLNIRLSRCAQVLDTRRSVAAQAPFLAYEHSVPGQGCQLELQLATSLPERKNRVLINGEEVGLLSHDRLDDQDRERYSISTDLLATHQLVEAAVIPEAGNYLGWDIVSAKISARNEE